MYASYFANYETYLKFLSILKHLECNVHLNFRGDSLKENMSHSKYDGYNLICNKNKFANNFKKFVTVIQIIHSDRSTSNLHLVL